MDFEFKKKFGQNFLTDTNLLTQIVEKSGIMSDDVVVEIGAGKGALTNVLKDYANKVYSFEIDSDYYNYWNYDEIKDNYNIKEEDFNTINSRFYKLVDNSIRNCRDNKFAWDIVNMNSELGRYGYECIEYFGNCSEEEIINSIREQDLMFLENGDVYNG